MKQEIPSNNLRVTILVPSKDGILRSNKTKTKILLASDLGEGSHSLVCSISHFFECMNECTEQGLYNNHYQYARFFYACAQKRYS